MINVLRDNPVLSGIYSITCTSNGKAYLGSSKNVLARWERHLRLLRRGNHHNPYLQYAFQRHGEKSLEFSVIENLEGCSPGEIREVEQIYLDLMDWSESFNVCKDSRGGEIREESNERRKETLRKFYQENPEALHGEGNPFYGKKHTLQTKELISKKNSGLTRSEEFKRKKSEFMSSRKGRHHSKEHLEELRTKYSGSGNPMAISVTVNGVVYPTKKQALAALGLKYGYQLDKLLNAERLSREGVGSSDPKRVPPSEEG